MRHKIEHRGTPLITQFPLRQQFRNLPNRHRLQSRFIRQGQLHPFIDLQKNPRQIPGLQIIANRFPGRTPSRKLPAILLIIAMHPPRRENPQYRLHLIGRFFQLRIQLFDHKFRSFDLPLNANPLGHRTRGLGPTSVCQRRLLDPGEQFDLCFWLIFRPSIRDFLPLGIPWPGTQNPHHKAHPN